MTTMRVGNGFDVHRWAAAGSARRLVLGGVRFDDVNGLDGHSDADPVAHACTDALLGAAGLGDIGVHFPDTDERWRDADSIELLRAVRGMLSDAGHKPVNIDATLACEAPKLSLFRDEMRRRMAEAAGLDPGAVNVKFTTGERMGFVGRGEGIAALAIATVA